jgi:hypothetical protein
MKNKMRSYRTKSHAVYATSSHSNVIDSSIRQTRAKRFDVLDGNISSASVRSSDIDRKSNVPITVSPPNNNGMISLTPEKTYDLQKTRDLDKNNEKKHKSSILARSF